MPRPKRARIAPSILTSSAANTLPTSPQERAVPEQPSDRIAEVSDDSEGIVTTSKKLTNLKGVPKKDVYMSGGLGPGDVKDAHRKPGARRPKPTGTLLDTSRAKEHAKAIEGLY